MVSGFSTQLMTTHLWRSTMVSQGLVQSKILSPNILVVSIFPSVTFPLSLVKGIRILKIWKPTNRKKWLKKGKECESEAHRVFSSRLSLGKREVQNQPLRCLSLSRFWVSGILKLKSANQKLLNKKSWTSFLKISLVSVEQQNPQPETNLSSIITRKLVPSKGWESTSPSVLLHLNKRATNLPNWSWKKEQRKVLTKRMSNLRVFLWIYSLCSLLFSVAQLLTKLFQLNF